MHLIGLINDPLTVCLFWFFFLIEEMATGSEKAFHAIANPECVSRRWNFCLCGRNRRSHGSKAACGFQRLKKRGRGGGDARRGESARVCWILI